MFGFGILTGLLVLPLVGAGFILMLRGNEHATLQNVRWTALLTTLVTFILSLVAWAQFDVGNAGFQLVEQKAWIGNGISFRT